MLPRPAHPAPRPPHPQRRCSWSLVAQSQGLLAAPGGNLWPVLLDAGLRCSTGLSRPPLPLRSSPPAGHQRLLPAGGNVPGPHPGLLFPFPAFPAAPLKGGLGRAGGPLWKKAPLLSFGPSHGLFKSEVSLTHSLPGPAARPPTSNGGLSTPFTLSSLGAVSVSC